IDLMRELDLEVAGEFLVMAATLMSIKSKELLPVDQQVTPEGGEEGEDPRRELIRKLVEDKKLKAAAGRLQVVETAAENTFARLPGKAVFDHLETDTRQTASIFELLNAVNSILKRFNEREDLRDIFEDKWTVSEKIETILTRIKTASRLR